MDGSHRCSSLERETIATDRLPDRLARHKRLQYARSGPLNAAIRRTALQVRLTNTTRRRSSLMPRLANSTLPHPRPLSRKRARGGFGLAADRARRSLAVTAWCSALLSCRPRPRRRGPARPHTGPWRGDRPCAGRVGPVRRFAEHRRPARRPSTWRRTTISARRRPSTRAPRRPCSARPTAAGRGRRSPRSTGSSGRRLFVHRGALYMHGHERPLRQRDHPPLDRRRRDVDRRPATRDPACCATTANTTAPPCR